MTSDDRRQRPQSQRFLLCDRDLKDAQLRQLVDCGANEGSFAEVMATRFACRVLAFEPSPLMFRRIPKNPMIDARNLAVCSKDGPVRFLIDDDSTRSTIVHTAIPHKNTTEIQGHSLQTLLSEAGILGKIEVIKNRYRGGRAICNRLVER